jgi:hypothetical protein
MVVVKVRIVEMRIEVKEMRLAGSMDLSQWIGGALMKQRKALTS